MSKPDNSACNQEMYVSLRADPCHSVFNNIFHCIYRFDLMMQCWEYEPERRPTFTELYAKTASYVERLAGYLELNFCNPNPLVSTTTTKVTLSVAEPHSGDEEQLSSDDSDAL